MSSRLGKDKVANFLHDIYSCENIVSESVNWHRLALGRSEMVIYVAQSKPSSHGKGNWYYEFWNSVNLATVGKILDRSGSLMLFDYVNKRYCILNKEDIIWTRENSTRNRGERGLVCDFVIKQTEGGGFYLTAYVADTGLFRKVEVNSCR